MFYVLGILELEIPVGTSIYPIKTGTKITVKSNSWDVGAYRIAHSCIFHFCFSEVKS